MGLNRLDFNLFFVVRKRRYIFGVVAFVCFMVGTIFLADVVGEIKEAKRIERIAHGLVSSFDTAQVSLQEPDKLEHKVAMHGDKKERFDVSFIDNYSIPKVDFELLLGMNPDTVGWIFVPGTNINYPVLQSNDNDTYMSKDFYGEQSSAGWIFADYRLDFSRVPTNIVLYGHNQIDKVMLGQLFSLVGKARADEGPVQVFFLKGERVYVYEVFSIATVDPFMRYISPGIGSTARAQEYVDMLRGLEGTHFFNKNMRLPNNPYFLSLVTCRRNNQRLVVSACLVVSAYIN